MASKAQTESMLTDSWIHVIELVWYDHMEVGVRNTRLVAVTASCISLNSTNRALCRNAFLLLFDLNFLQHLTLVTLQSFDCFENL